MLKYPFNLLNVYCGSTCAYWKIWNVLIAEVLFVRDVVSEEPQTRATYNGNLRPVSRPAHQPFCSQFTVIK